MSTAWESLSDPVRLRIVAALAIALDGVADARLLRRAHAARTAYQREFAARLRSIPEPRAVVFVRYAPGHVYHNSLIENAPDWRAASRMSSSGSSSTLSRS